jgi:hypothetical protein
MAIRKKQEPQPEGEQEQDEQEQEQPLTALTDPNNIRLERVTSSRRGYSVEDAYRVLAGLPPGPVDVSDAPARGPQPAADADENRSGS